MKTETVSEIVRQDFRTSDVFRKYDINFCCGGQQSLEEVCRQHNLDLEGLRGELEGAARRVTLPGSIDVSDWSIEFLIEYIVNIYHASLKQHLPLLNAEAAAFAGSHSARYPQAPRLARILEELSALLLEHMAKEEDSLFPYLRQISSTHKRRETYGSLFVRTLSKPLDQIKKLEHTHISALLDQLRRVANNYQFAADACNGYRVLLQKLKELDADLVQHKHLENHILFPKAMALERELLQL